MHANITNMPLTVIPDRLIVLISEKFAQPPARPTDRPPTSNPSIYSRTGQPHATSTTRHVPPPITATLIKQGSNLIPAEVGLRSAAVSTGGADINAPQMAINRVGPAARAELPGHRRTQGERYDERPAGGEPMRGSTSGGMHLRRPLPFMRKGSAWHKICHRERKAADDDDELSDVDAGSAGDSHEAKKRRSDTNAEDDDDTEDELPPHIPAPVWGHVLDYMPYGEVRSALLVGKIIAVEAVKYVQTLNIMNGWEMDVPSARRFANVTEVNILSLLHFHPQDEEFDYYLRLCETTAERMVPFIVGFQKLKRIHAGGLDPEDNEFMTYDDAKYYLPDDDAANSGEILQTFVAPFIGALSTRLLPTALESLVGITSVLKYVRPCRLGHARGDAPPNSCKYCSKVLKYFPVKDLLTLQYQAYANGATCFSTMEELNVLAERHGFKERCRELSEKCLVSFIRVSLSEFDIKDDGLCERLQNMGVTAHTGFSYLDSDGMATIDRLIAFGFDPKSVSQQSLYEKLLIGSFGRMRDVYDKSTFEFLVSRGFPFAEADLILLDKTKEPALKELREESD